MMHLLLLKYSRVSGQSDAAQTLQTNHMAIDLKSKVLDLDNNWEIHKNEKIASHLQFHIL